MCIAATLTRAYAGQIQLYLDVNLLYTLVIIRKILSKQQHIDVPETVSDPSGGDLKHMQQRFTLSLWV